MLEGDVALKVQKRIKDEDYQAQKEALAKEKEVSLLIAKTRLDL